MPITDSFDDTSPEIIHARDLVDAVPGFPDVAIATFATRTLALMRDEFALTPLTIIEDGTGHIDVWAYDDPAGHRFAVYGSPMGAPFAVTTLEHLVAFGVSKFVFFGECGVLDASIPSGHIIVPTSAYRDEGTSYHYAPAADWIDIPTAAKTQQFLRDAGVPHVAGKVWTTDAFFRETRAVVERRRKAGCIAVDMECSALAAAAAWRDVSVYQFLTAADNLDAETWDSRVLGKMPAEPRLAYARVALELARRIAT